MSEDRPLDIPQGVIEDDSWSEAYFRGLIRGALRRIYFRFPGRKASFDRVRVEIPGVTKGGLPKKRPEVWYKCELCGSLGKAQVSKTNPKGHLRMWLDHDPPLVPVDREIGWSEYVERLFCTSDKARVLCDVCHKACTQIQNAERREWRKRTRAGNRSLTNRDTKFRPGDDADPQE